MHIDWSTLGYLLKCAFTLGLLKSCQNKHNLGSANSTTGLLSSTAIFDSTSLLNSTGISSAGYLPRLAHVPPKTFDSDVYFCTGHLRGVPTGDCPPDTCTYYNASLTTIRTKESTSGTNCMDTNCLVMFSVCNKRGLCNEIDQFTASVTPWGRCCYNVPGTDNVQLWA